MNPPSSVVNRRGHKHKGPRRSEPSPLPQTTPPSRGYFRLPLALTLLLFAFVFFPPVRDNESLVWTFTSVSVALLAWQAILWVVAKRGNRTFGIDFVPPVKSHYVQACVQLSIYIYWGLYWPEIFTQFPLIFAQLVFLYVFDALLTWSRGRSWRLGFGPLPIILSINVFLWFRADWFIFQFLLVAVCALGKEFIRWERDGRRTHIFNPSAFGLSVFSLVLILTATTKELTWARELASTLDIPPHIFLLIFLLGLVVQYFFSITLMVLSATAVLCLLNLIYTGSTGVYQFITLNISASVFLGLHLLMTDPATSPRSNVGRVIFGALYGVGNWVLFDILSYFDAPELYTKLLIVPVLNLGVPLVERWSRTGWLGGVNRAWETALQPRTMNFIHMAGWGALFTTMLATGFVEGPHKGNSILFWKQAEAEGKPWACKKKVIVSLVQASSGSGPANNELGLISMEGNEYVEQSNGKAARFFSQACALGDFHGSANVAIQFLFLKERRSDEDVARAFAQLEQRCSQGVGGLGCYLMGYAYETGRGRPLDTMRAIELYRQCGRDDLFASKGLARIGLSGTSPPFDLTEVAAILQAAAAMGDAESCWYLAFMHHEGNGVQPDDQQARAYLQRACELGLGQACDALKQPDLPPFSNPVIVAPGWSTAFPVS